MRLRVSLSAAALLLLAGTASAAPCPGSQAQLVGYNNLFTIPAAVFDTTLTVNGELFGQVALDLVSGTLRFSHPVRQGANWTRVIATDAYDVTGPPPGTPVSLTAELVVTGELDSPGCGGSGCGGWFQASITQGSASAPYQHTFPNVFAGGTVTCSPTLTLPVTIIAGSPTRVDFELAVFVPAGGNAGGAGRGSFRFTGLPPGASVVSCHGYNASTTPIRRSTWGRLKAFVR